jgi:hypothetical protein
MPTCKIANTDDMYFDLSESSWSNELVVRQSPAGKNVNTEAEDTVGIRHQTTTDEDIAN